MAGIDKEYTGEAWVAEGARVGYLEQEPQLDAAKTVRENVMLGVAKQKAILDRYNELAVNYSDETADEMTKLQDEIEAAGPLGSRQQGRSGDGRAALPARRCRRDKTLRRRAPPRRAVQAAARPARTAAAGRADQPSRRRVGVMAGRPSAQLSRRDPDRHPRPLLPRQRHGLDSRTRPRQGHSLRGQLLRPGWRRSRSGSQQEGREEAAHQKHAGARAGMDRVLAEGAPGQIQGALPAL